MHTNLELELADISASRVMELRQRTGLGMMECKKALAENGGNIDAASEWLRKQGLAKADKKASRVAAEGRIVHAQAGNKAVLVEINSETDFVAKDENFLKFASEVAEAAVAQNVTDVESLKNAKLAVKLDALLRGALEQKPRKLAGFARYAHRRWRWSTSRKDRPGSSRPASRRIRAASCSVGSAS